MRGQYVEAADITEELNLFDLCGLCKDIKLVIGAMIQLLEVQNILGSFGTGIYLELNGRKFWVCRMKLVKH